MMPPFVPSLGASASTSDWNSAVTLVSACSVSWQVWTSRSRRLPAEEAHPPGWRGGQRHRGASSDGDVAACGGLAAVQVGAGDGARPVVATVRCTCCTTKLAKTLTSGRARDYKYPLPLQSLPHPANV